MEFVYDPEKLTTNQTIIIQAVMSPGSAAPIVGILANPPVLNGSLNFIEIDAEGHAREFQLRKLKDAGIVPDEHGTMNSIYRTAVLDDQTELYGVYHEALNRYVRHCDTRPKHLHFQVMVGHSAR